MILYGNNLILTSRCEKSLNKYDYKIIDTIDEVINDVSSNEIVIISNINIDEKKNTDFLVKLVENEAKIVFLDPTPSYEKGKKLVALGIKAYANFMINDVHLNDVIKNVLANNVWLYPEFINTLVLNMATPNQENEQENGQYKDNKQFEQLDILTSREKEVALLVLDKLPYSEISDKLDISIRTVKAHTKHIFEKFNVKNRLRFILKFHK